MKKVNDPEAFKWIEKSGLALKYSDVSISDFLKMHYKDMKEEIQEIKEDDGFEEI
jgi:predicted house-cleaning noncanonical NTP pyrophosphatase (MazG superfamily)